ncbi:hypothetical protein BDV97DRAFT_371916 [Delphinella strobiligena]|nr:hypothetical protein BDV97DRAFT_371916 [Delphinella strobiligena]
MCDPFSGRRFVGNILPDVIYLDFVLISGLLPFCQVPTRNKQSPSLPAPVPLVNYNQRLGQPYYTPAGSRDVIRHMLDALQTEGRVFLLESISPEPRSIATAINPTRDRSSVTDVKTTRTPAWRTTPDRVVIRAKLRPALVTCQVGRLGRNERKKAMDRVAQMSRIPRDVDTVWKTSHLNLQQYRS